MADNNQTPIKKTILNDPKLKLTGPIQEGAKRPPSLAFTVFCTERGTASARFDVFTEIPNDKSNQGGRISAPMSITEAEMMLDLLLEVVDGPEDVYFVNDNKTGAPNKQQLVSKTYIGKDSNGRVYIAVLADGRPTIKFIFNQSDWHHLRHGDGSEITEAEMSRRVARSYAHLMKRLMTQVSHDNYIAPPPGGYNNNNNNRRGGGGGGNWNNNSGGGNSGGGNDGGFGGGGGSNDGWPM